jgi:serine protease Do
MKSIFPRLRPISIAAAVVVFSMLWVISARAAPYEQNLVTAIEEVARTVVPAVVHIEVTEKQSVPNQLLPFQNDPFFQYFFGRQGRMPKSFEREVTGLGSGILIDARGDILTNSHVINGATKMTVVLSDGRKYTGKSVKLIGIDAKTDLAVIKILSRESFPFAAFGDSDRLHVGQWVVAIGHPRGLDQTVTQGIISAKHRQGISDPRSYQDFLQTDAAINPGNSGGPLLNLSGEVVGVCAAIMTESGGFEGIGFATPGNMAQRVARQLIASGKVQRGYLGMTIQNLTPELANSFGAGATKGVLVANVLKDGPAEKAGIKQGDLIVAYGGKPVENPDAFRNDVAVTDIGSTVALTVLRGGTSHDFDVKVSSDEEQGKALLNSVGERFGIEVKPMENKDAQKYGLNGAKGVLVTRVEAKGPFGKAGIETDDIILQIDQKDIAGPDEFGEILSTAPPRTKVVVTVVDHRTMNAGLIKLAAP